MDLYVYIKLYSTGGYGNLGIPGFSPVFQSVFVDEYSSNTINESDKSCNLLVVLVQVR